MRTTSTTITIAIIVTVDTIGLVAEEDTVVTPGSLGA
jgi:hypothetical protein